MKKKFTRGGGAPLVLTIIALIISLAASFQEYLGRWIYNIAFKADADKVFVSDIIGYFTMERNSVSVIRMYVEKAFIMALVAFVAFIVLAASARKKKIVSGEAWMMIITSAACAIEPVMYMIYFFSNSLHENLTDGSDGERFRSFYGLLIYALPLLAAFLLIIAGFILLIRLAKETAVDISDEAIEEQDAVNFAENTYIPAPAAAPQAEAVMDEVAIPQNVQAPVTEQIENTVQMPSAEPVAEEVAEAIETATEQPSEPMIEPIIVSQEQKVFCANCGQQLDADAKFCNNCGTKRD